MRPEPRLVGVLLLVVIAGCSGVTGGVDDPTITVTPAEVPDVATPTATAEPTPTPRARSGFADPAGRAATHAGILANTSYAVVASQEFRFPETNRTSHWRMRGRFDREERFLVEITKNGTIFGTGSPRRSVYWSNGESVVEALVTNRSSGREVSVLARHETVPPRLALPVDPRFEQELTRIFASTAIVAVTPIQRVGQEYERVRITLTGPTQPARAPTARATLRIQNLTARVVIDGRGFVQRIHLRYEGTIYGQPVLIRQSIRYGALGATTVERPAWADELRNETEAGNDR